MAKHELGEVWKENRAWKVQLPNGVHTTTTKKRARLFSMSVSTDSNVQQELSRILGTGVCNHEFGPDSTVKDHLVAMTGRWIRACMVCSVSFAKG